MGWIVIGYYTRGSLYEVKAQTLLSSLNRFNIPHCIEGVENLGTWQKNISYKPTFVKEMMEKHHPNAVVYVDCDAEFMRYPELFDRLIKLPEVHVSVYLFDRSCYKKSAHGFEVLSGTIFLQNDEESVEVVRKWEIESRENPHIWDQKTLEKVLNNNYYLLPGEYCKIFDRMNDITDPVIVHYQASREFRRMYPDKVH